MRLLTVPKDPASADMIGGVVVRDVRGSAPGQGMLFRKGHVLTADDIGRLASVPIPEIRVLMPEPADEPESSAAARLGAAVAGRHVVVAPPHHGQAALKAEQRGLLKVRTNLLRQLNGIEGVLVFTAYDGTPVDRGAVVGGTKVVPLLIPRETTDAAVELCHARGSALELLPFRPTPVALLATESLGQRVLARAHAHLAAKVGWFGSHIERVDAGLRDAAAVAASFRAARAAGMGLVLTAGGVATDPADILVEGLRLAGGSIEQMGLPVDPGTACWIGRLGSLTVIGLASCELTARPGAVDLLLARVFAGIRLSRTVVQGLAHGGIVDPRLSRFPAYPVPPTLDAARNGEPA